MKSGTKAPDVLASTSRRIYARFIDCIPFVLFSLVCKTIYAVVNDVPFKTRSPGVMLFVAVCWSLYEWRFIAATGQTPGKKAIGVRVVSRDGTPLGSKAWLRILLILPLTLLDVLNRHFVWLTVLLDIANIAMLVYARQHRTMHDRIAGTLVVDVRHERAARTELSK